MREIREHLQQLLALDLAGSLAPLPELELSPALAASHAIIGRPQSRFGKREPAARAFHVRSLSAPRQVHFGGTQSHNR